MPKPTRWHRMPQGVQAFHMRACSKILSLLDSDAPLAEFKRAADELAAELGRPVRVRNGGGVQLPLPLRNTECATPSK